MGDMGDDIVKSMAAGCLICLVFICIIIGFEYYLFGAFFGHHKATFDAVLVFSLVSVFFILAMWRLYIYAVKLI